MGRKQVREVVFDDENESINRFRNKREKKDVSLAFFSNRQLEQERRSLPVYQYRQQIINSVKKNPTTIIVGETGSGKTTQIAQYLHESGFFR